MTLLPKTLITLGAVQAGLGTAVLLRGFPYFGTHLVSNAPLWEAPVALFHLPGVAALSLAGLCCGFRNGLVLGPKIVAGHIPVTLPGAAILVGANLLVWASLVALACTAWQVRSRRRAAQAGSLPPPATPGP
jgi:hypothetical protein